MSDVLAPAERDAIFKKGYADPVYFCRTFLAHWFGGDAGQIPWLHRGLLAILQRRADFLIKYGELDKIIRHFVYRVDPSDPKSEERPIFSLRINDDGDVLGVDMALGKFTNFLLPRGFSKTTICNASNLIDIVYLEAEYLVYISESQPHAEKQVVTIRGELEANNLLHAVFGHVVPGRQDSEKWTNDTLQTTTGVTVEAKGRNSQIRGMNVNSKRPDRITIDDVEDEESVRTDEQRAKMQDFFWGSVYPALDRMKPSARITCLGTMLHEDALLVTLSKSPIFTTCVFGAIDRDGDALWAKNMSLEQIELNKKEYARQGKLAIFYREFFSSIRNDDTAKFKGRYIHHMDSGTDQIVGTALALDPGLSDNIDKADYQALGVVSMLRNGKFQVQEAELEKGLSPRQMVDWFFEYYTKWQPYNLVAGIEGVAFQAALIHLVVEEMARRKTFFECQKLMPGRINKIIRVEGILQPRYAAGYVQHRMPFPLYETQLLDWPRGKKDGPDVISMAVSMLDPHALSAIPGGQEELDKPLPPLEGEYYDSNFCP